jgi:tetratricopeptide (TPR) repeat protein
LGCAHALQKPPPLESTVGVPDAPSAQLLAQADAAWARRAEPGQAAAAEQLYLLAARADPHNPESFAGAIRAKSFRLGREKDAAERGRLAKDAVDVGQLCEENQLAAATCDYWLAVGLGLQARERTATAHDAMSLMVDLLKRAARNGAGIDHGGPHRLLAILLLRAPGWPLGPGDPEAALPEAQSAVRIAPEYPPNQLALGEALQKNGRAPQARSAYSEALRLATTEPASADPDAAGWADEARAALR